MVCPVRGSESQSLSGSHIQFTGDFVTFCLSDFAHAHSFGEILPKQAIGVLIAPPLAGAVGITKVGRRRHRLGNRFGHRLGRLLGEARLATRGGVLVASFPDSVNSDAAAPAYGRGPRWDGAEALTGRATRTRPGPWSSRTGACAECGKARPHSDSRV